MKRDDLQHISDKEPNAYEQRQEAKRERFEELAEKAKRDSAAAYEQSSRMASVIPFGQPILVGHHSEKRDRNYRDRIARKMDQSCELASKARYYEQRAASVGKGGISSDDPEAIQKLQAEIAKLEQLQDTMKRANALVRKQDRAGLAALGFSEQRISQLFAPDFCGRLGFPDYALTNNSANIRRIRQRIEQLGQRPTESSEQEAEGFTLREDATENRIMFLFPGKPPEAVRDILKASGFKWSPTRGAWVRFLNDAGRAAAQYAASKIQKQAGPEGSSPPAPNPA